MRTKPRVDDPVKNFSISFPASRLNELDNDCDKTGKSRSETLLVSWLSVKEKNKGIA